MVIMFVSPKLGPRMQTVCLDSYNTRVYCLVWLLSHCVVETIGLSHVMRLTFLTLCAHIYLLNYCHNYLCNNGLFKTGTIKKWIFGLMIIIVSRLYKRFTL